MKDLAYDPRIGDDPRNIRFVFERTATPVLLRLAHCGNPTRANLAARELARRATRRARIRAEWLGSFALPPAPPEVRAAARADARTPDALRARADARVKRAVAGYRAAASDAALRYFWRASRAAELRAARA